MTLHALIISPHAAITEVELPDDPHQLLAALYAVIGCDTVDLVELTPDLSMWLDDNGMLVNEPVVNLAATLLAHHYGHHSQLYFGTALLTGGADPPGDTLGLECDLSQHIRQLLNPPHDGHA